PTGPRHDEPPRVTLGYSTALGGGHPPAISRLLHRSVAAGVLESIREFGYLRRAQWRIATLQELSPAERQKAAIDGKKQLVEQYRAKLADPEFAKRQEARRAIVAAREARITERKAAEQAHRAREAAEKAAQ